MGQGQEIGKALKRLREGAGLSQRQLAERLCIHQPAIARWETGGVQLPVNRLEEVLEVLGYGIDYDLKAVPFASAMKDGVPVRLVRRRSKGLKPAFDSLRVISAGYEFSVNPERPWNVQMRNVETDEMLPGALGVYPERVTAITAHPDGVLVRTRSTVGKIVPSAKLVDGNVVFAYMLAVERDLELSGVSDLPDWNLASL